MNASDIIHECKRMCIPNEGVKSIAIQDCCIMDELCTRYPYKEEGGCLDYTKCGSPQYMLACLATRDPSQISDWVVDTYNAAMKDK